MNILRHPGNFGIDYNQVKHPNKQNRQTNKQTNRQTNKESAQQPHYTSIHRFTFTPITGKFYSLS